MAIRDDSLLIRLAKAGSKEALNTVFERYGERLLALVRLRLGPSLRNQLESRDVLQATLLTAFRKIDQFEGSGSRTLMAWLGVIATNEIRDQAEFHGRKRRDATRTVGLQEALDEIDPTIRSEVSRLHLEERVQRLERALGRLSERHQKVILLRTFEELTFEQIGKRLGKSADASRMLFARAMAALTLNVRDEKKNPSSPPPC